MHSRQNTSGWKSALPAPSTQKFVITHRILLSIYIFIPVIAAIVLLDIAFLRGYLRNVLPHDPEQLRIYLVVLVFPHIVASAISFVDREYFIFYRTRLLSSVAAAIALGVGVPFIFGSSVGIFVYISYTMFHLITQQAGVALFMVGKPTTTFRIWRWAAIIASISVGCLILIGSNIANMHFGRLSLLAILQPTTGTALIVMFITSIVVSSRSKTQIGALYIFANFLLVLLAYILFAIGYSFFAICLPRIIHDVTGFLFYSVHDGNRNALRRSNLFYRLFRFTGIPVYVLCPFLAIAVANILVQMRTHSAIGDFLISLTFFHYYTEGFMWKGQSFHRQFTPVVGAT